MSRSGLGLVTAPILYRGTSPPLALHNHASVTPSGGARTSEAHRVDYNGALYLVLEAANHIRSSLVKDTVSGLYLPGVLLEPQSINEVKRSQEINLWTPSNATVAVNDTAAPDSSASAEKVTASGAGVGTHYVRSPATSSGGGTKLVSVYVKKTSTSTSGKVTLAIFSDSLSYAHFDLDGPATEGVTGDFSAQSIEEFGGGWYRISGVASPSGNYLTYVFCRDSNGDVSFDSALGDVSYFVWGMQGEAQPFATSYIPTAALAVTRTADSALVWTLGSEMANKEWTLLAPVCVPAHTPASNLKLLTIYKNGAAGTDHVTLWADTSKRAYLTSAASGKSAGAVTVTGSDICDGEIHWVSIHARDGQLHCFAQSNDGQFHAADLDAGIAPDLDRFSIEPSGGWVGGVQMEMRFRQRMPRPKQPQLLEV